MKLTPLQQDTYDYILSFFKIEGRPPSLKDLKLYFGWASKTMACKNVDALLHKGFIEKDSIGRIVIPAHVRKSLYPSK